MHSQGQQHQKPNSSNNNNKIWPSWSWRSLSAQCGYHWCYFLENQRQIALGFVWHHTWVKKGRPCERRVGNWCFIHKNTFYSIRAEKWQSLYTVYSLSKISKLWQERINSKTSNQNKEHTLKKQNKNKNKAIKHKPKTSLPPHPTKAI